MTHEELLHGRPARISTRSTNGTPRTTGGAILPGTEPTGMYQPTAGFTGRAPVSAPAGVYRVDAPIRLSFFVFVIRRSNNPAAGRAEEGGRWTARARRATACASAALALAPANARYRIRNAAKRRAHSTRDRAGVGGQGPVELDPRRRPAGRRAGRTCRARSESCAHRTPTPSIRTIKNSLQILTHLTTSRRYLDTHKLQQSLQQKTQRKGACPRVRGCV
jgi:hypothetical protein